jgi:chromate transporter
MHDDQFWLGIPLTFVIPGVPTNVAVYYGTIIHGVFSGLLSWVFLHLPSILILYGILPNWDSYR